MPREPVLEVVAGVDDTPDSTAVLDLAAAEATLRSAPLTLVHVSANAEPDVLPGAIARVRATHPDLPIHAEPLSGDPATTLASRSAGAGLLVLGRCRHRRRRRTGPGDSESVAATALGRAMVPVLICPNASPRTGDAPVVVGIDGTPGSEAALRFGFAAAALRHAPLAAMHLRPPLARPQPGRGETNAAEDAFLDLLDTWSGKYPDVPVRLSVRHDLDPAIVLVAASRSARVVVVAGSAPGAMTGPILAALAARAACPVAVVPSVG